MEILEVLLTSEFIVPILAAVIIVLYRMVIKDNFHKEFKTAAQIIELLAENHNIEPVDLLYEALEESGKLDKYTGDLEEGIREEIKEKES